MELSDADLVRRAKLGQKDAFGVLVDQHRDAVFSICFSRCGNFTDAQDLAQEAFIRAYINLHQLKKHDKFAPWLYQIAQAACVDWFRGYKHASLPLNDFIAIAPTIVEDELTLRETRHHIGDALLKLPKTHKLIATLHYMGGYTCDEISEMTGASVAVVWERLRTARKKLKNHLLEEFSEEAKHGKPGRGLTRRVLSGVAAYEKEDTFSHMYALRAVLEYHGNRVNWDYLLGSSGEAFSIYFNPQWMYHCRFVHSWDVADTACRAFGYKSKWHIGESFETALELIEQSIQHGLPAIAPGINPSVSKHGGTEYHYWFVVTEIDRERKQLSLIGVGEQNARVQYPWMRLPGCTQRGWHGFTRHFNHYSKFMAANPVLLIEPDCNHKSNCMDMRASALKSLRRAVQLAQEKPIFLQEGSGQVYYGGLTALKHFSDELSKTIKVDFSQMEPQINVRELFGTSIYSICRRMEVSRRAAASYVHTLAESRIQLPESELISAANRYETVANLARALFELYFDPAEETEMWRTIAKYPKPLYFQREELLKFWDTFHERFISDPEQRRRGVELIRAMADEERAAVHCLDKLVAEWGDLSSTQDQQSIRRNIS